MCTILVIDDERNITAIIQEALGLFGHNVDVAHDGREGIDKFDQNDFDLVITDMRMPDMDGTQIVEHIRRSDKRSRTPVIGISGTPWLLDRADFDTVIAKPFPLQILIEIVERLTTSETVDAPAERKYA